jgi:hypothetical protein
MGSQSAFYVAWGSGIEEAVRSRKSLKKHNPDLEVTIVRAEELDLQLSDGQFERKVEMIDHFLKTSEADRIVYLDADTEIFGSIQGIFDALLYSDLAMALAPVAVTNEDVPDAIATYNTGVIGIRAEAFSITELWLHATYLSETDDQWAMRWLLHHSDFKVATLLPRYNFRPKFPVYLSGKPIIVHTHAGRSIAKLSKLKRGLWKGS